MPCHPWACPLSRALRAGAAGQRVHVPCAPQAGWAGQGPPKLLYSLRQGSSFLLCYKHISSLLVSQPPTPLPQQNQKGRQSYSTLSFSAPSLERGRGWSLSLESGKEGRRDRTAYLTRPGCFCGVLGDPHPFPSGPESFPEDARPVPTLDALTERLPEGAGHDALQGAGCSSTFFLLHRPRQPL